MKTFKSIIEYFTLLGVIGVIISGLLWIWIKDSIILKNLTYTFLYVFGVGFITFILLFSNDDDSRSGYT